MAQIEDRWKTEPSRTGTGLRWRVRYHDDLGKHRTLSFRTKTEAERYKREVEQRLDRGTYVDPAASQVPFEEFAIRWLRSAPDLKPRTFENYDGIIRNHLAPAIGRTPLSRLRPEHLRDLIRDRRNHGLSDSTVRRIVRVASTILKTAVTDRILTANPADGVRLPRESVREMRFLTGEELIELVDKVQPHYRTYVLTAGVLGARSGELRGLHPTRLNLLKGQVQIIEQLEELGGSLKRTTPKTAASTRTITIPRFLISELEQQLAERSSTDFVFTTRDGMPIRASNFNRRIWQPATASAGFAGLRFHDLRHTAASLAIAVGAHPKAIQERLGHSSITVTLDRYGHLFPALDEVLAQRLEDTYGNLLAPRTRPKAI
jgi:integrase